MLCQLLLPLILSSLVLAQQPTGGTGPGNGTGTGTGTGTGNGTGTGGRPDPNCDPILGCGTPDTGDTCDGAGSPGYIALLPPSRTSIALVGNPFIINWTYPVS